MWSYILTISMLTILAKSEEKIPNTNIMREVSDGLTSQGYQVVYGDEDLTIVNDLVSREEKNMARKFKKRYEDHLDELPAEDVKCLMSVDRWCSAEMGETKRIIVQAVKDDCAKCTVEEKERAGKVIASMMAHYPYAWKMFLTRYDGPRQVERILG